MSLFERKRDRDPDPYAPPKIRDLNREPTIMNDGTPVPPRLVRNIQDELPRASSLPAALDDTAQDLDALRDAIKQEASAGNLPAVYQERKPTDLEQIAWWGKYLTYTDMKKFAADVLAGKMPTTPAEFADLFEEWCRKNTEPPQTEEPAP